MAAVMITGDNESLRAPLLRVIAFLIFANLVVWTIALGELLSAPDRDRYAPAKTPTVTSVPLDPAQVRA